MFSVICRSSTTFLSWMFSFRCSLTPSGTVYTYPGESLQVFGICQGLCSLCSVDCSALVCYILAKCFWRSVFWKGVTMLHATMHALCNIDKVHSCILTVCVLCIHKISITACNRCSRIRNNYLCTSMGGYISQWVIRLVTSGANGKIPDYRCIISTMCSFYSFQGLVRSGLSRWVEV